MDLFSRTLDKSHYDQARKIHAALQAKQPGTKMPRVKTWELYDKSFTWPKIRNYEIVQEGMETLEHFEDNLNTNITNSKLLERFLQHALAVRATFAEKFHNGEFKDPANEDPEAKK